MKILVVDDSMTARKILISNLSLLGFRDFTEASNGQEAINLYIELEPDFVFMDIVMPIMDGIAALENIMAEYPQARIIICSSMGQKEYIKKAIIGGAREFIIKPIEIERLREVMTKILDYKK